MDTTQDLSSSDSILQKFASVIENPKKVEPGVKLYTGVDLGTAYLVLAVIDEEGNPVAGAMQFAQVVKDGLVVDYLGAVDIVRGLKVELEEKLGRVLDLAAVAFPPGTGKGDARTIRNVAEAAGFEVIAEIDEPTAANAVLGITDGAVVDIGGGTTGTAIIQAGKVVNVSDDPTGGTHFSLVIAGAFKISFEEAEDRKKSPQGRTEVIHLLRPVMEKVAFIINNHLKEYSVEAVYLAGGTSCLEGIENVVSQIVGVPVLKPANPFLVTPLGIAMYCRAGSASNE
ncbi:ethanolamine utilization protein EutJ [Desulfotomaculum sp. 1211_IL3151]|uniref:ethanolamine utilization protein EutJ n=1 Tax=Desulfotomaculum sp. 1211_IL3151 TaxID=3084055 RepID=UPI002FD93D2E